MKTLILLSGLPGCGKSTWSEQYRRTHKNVVIIASDEIRKELSGDYQDFSHEKEVWDVLTKRIIEYGKADEEVTVIVDATNLTNEYRRFYHSIASDYDRKWLIEIKKPWKTLVKQNKMRSKDKWVPMEAMKKLYASYEEPSTDVLNLYDEYRRINNWFDSNRVPEKWYGIGK